MDPPNRSNITTKELLDESISTYIDSRPLHRHKITTIHEVVATMSTSGHIEISPAAELKIQYSLRLKFNQRTMDQLQDALPSRTRSPNHILYRTHDDDFELYEVTHCSDDESILYTKRYNRDTSDYTADTYTITFDPVVPIKRSIEFEIQETQAITISSNKKRHFPDE